MKRMLKGGLVTAAVLLGGLALTSPASAQEQSEPEVCYQTTTHQEWGWQQQTREETFQNIYEYQRWQVKKTPTDPPPKQAGTKGPTGSFTNPYWISDDPSDGFVAADGATRPLDVPFIYPNGSGYWYVYKLLDTQTDSGTSPTKNGWATISGPTQTHLGWTDWVDTDVVEWTLDDAPPSADTDTVRWVTPKAETPRTVEVELEVECPFVDPCKLDPPVGICGPATVDTQPEPECTTGVTNELGGCEPVGSDPDPTTGAPVTTNPPTLPNTGVETWHMALVAGIVTALGFGAQKAARR